MYRIPRANLPGGGGLGVGNGVSIAGSWSNLHPSWVTRGKYVYVIILIFFFERTKACSPAVFLQGMRKQWWPPNDKNRHLGAWEKLREAADE